MHPQGHFVYAPEVYRHRSSTLQQKEYFYCSLLLFSSEIYTPGLVTAVAAVLAAVPAAVAHAAAVLLLLLLMLLLLSC